MGEGYHWELVWGNLSQRSMKPNIWLPQTQPLHWGSNVQTDSAARRQLEQGGCSGASQARLGRLTSAHAACGWEPTASRTHGGRS